MEAPGMATLLHPQPKTSAPVPSPCGHWLRCSSGSLFSSHSPLPSQAGRRTLPVGKAALSP